MDPSGRSGSRVAESENVAIKPMGHSVDDVRATVEISAVASILENWPPLARKATREMIDKYGFPHEATASRLIWFDVGFWKRTTVYRDEVPHNFPQPHFDVLEQVIDYRVPLDKIGELAKFDGSIIVERTRGEVAARCDMEAANILALNLMDEIVTGKLSAYEARQIYTDQTSRYMSNRSAPYVEKLQFVTAAQETFDPDEATMETPVSHEPSEQTRVPPRHRH